MRKRKGRPTLERVDDFVRKNQHMHMKVHCPVACIIILFAEKEEITASLLWAFAHAKRNEQVIERMDLLSLACKSPFPSLYSQPFYPSIVSIYACCEIRLYDEKGKQRTKLMIQVGI
jgi:hypothetical protein